MAYQWTPAQQKVINSEHNKILVSASSGSGKTTVMIERIVNLIKNHKISVDNILVTTFTNAAAQDMRNKLIDRLTDALQERQDKSFMLEQLQNAETAQICTLHSFCADLIRKYYYVAGVDSAFSVIQDLEASLKKSKALKKVFDQYLESGDEVFLRLCDIFTRKRRMDQLAKHINQIYTFYRTLPQSENWLRIEPQLDAIDEYINDYKRLADQYHIVRAKKIIEYAQKIGYEPAIEAATCILEGLPNGQFPSRLPQQRKPKDCDTFTFDFVEASSEFCKTAKKFYQKFYESMPEDDNSSQELVNKLLEVVGKFDKAYAELKKEDFELDFADLEHYAFDILSNEEVYNEIKQTYQYVFVDEYQDINPMQEAIINLFADSKLFFVGDVKQSIYRFRLCDPDIFIKKYQDFKSGADSNNIAIDLNDNFRSVKSILDFNNEIFSRIMTKDLGGVDYQNDARFFDNISDLNSPYPAVNIAIAQVPDEEKIEPDTIYSVKSHINQSIITDYKAEADIIINEISKILQDGRVLKDGLPQPPEYSDIVILFRSLKNKSFEIIKEISKVYPVVSGLETELLSRPEILMLIDYIKVIDNPYQDIALTGALKSVFGQTDENQLIKIRERYKNAEFFYQAVLEYKEKINDDISQKLNAFFENLEKDKKYAACHSLRELILRIITKYSYEEYLLTAFEQADYEYVELFLDLVLQYNTISEFLDYIDNDVISPIIEMPANAQSKAIRVMTIHQSKGLEFPIVFVCGLGNRFNRSNDEILIDQKVKLGLRNYDFENRVKSDSKTRSAISLFNQKKEMEEEMRVLYVALTRAKYHLVLTGAINQNYKLRGLEPFEILRSTRYIDWILAVLARDKTNLLFGASKFEQLSIAPCYNLEIIPIESIQNYLDFEKPKVSLSDKNLERQILENLNVFYQADRLNQKYTVTELSASEEIPQSVFIYKDQELSLGGIDRGNAYHALMKYIDLSCQSVDEVNAQMRELKERNLLSEDYIKLINPEKILKALKSDIILTAKQNTFYREREFLFYADASQLNLQGAGRVLVQGVIDLLIFTNEGIIIADYKTTKGSEKDLISLYQSQLGIYAKAAENILGEKVIQKTIYSFEMDKEIYL
jgi:ATP-dependent helicase/nuclease subunit A